MDRNGCCVCLLFSLNKENANVVQGVFPSHISILKLFLYAVLLPVTAVSSCAGGMHGMHCTKKYICFNSLFLPFIYLFIFACIFADIYIECDFDGVKPHHI